MMDQIEIRIATLTDIPVIIALEEKSWIATYPNELAGISEEDVAQRFRVDFKIKRTAEMEKEMLDDKHSYRVLVWGEKIVGYSHLLREEDFNDFVEIYVLSEYHGKGYGSLLIRDGVEWLRQNGKQIRLEVATYNVKAKAIYEHYGFKLDPTLSQPKDEDWNLLPSGIRIPVVFMVLD